LIRQNYAEFAQSLRLVALHQKKIRGLPGHLRGRWISLERVPQRQGLIGNVSQHLIGRGQVEPVTRGVRIELHGGLIRFDRFGRIPSNQRVIAAQMIAVVRVPGIKTSRPLQTSEFWLFSEEGGDKQSSR